MGKQLIYISMGFILVIFSIILIFVYQFKNDIFGVERVNKIKNLIKMSKSQKRRLLLISMLGISLIFLGVRAYNNRDEVTVVAKGASEYGIVEAKVDMVYKLEDLDTLYEIIERNYPFFDFSKRLNNKDWFDNKRVHKRLIKNTKNDAEFYLAIERILGEINDPNVRILSGYDYKWNYKNTYEHLLEVDDLNNFGLYGALRNPTVMYRYLFDGIEGIELYSQDNLETKVLIENELAYIRIEAMAGYDLLESDYNKIKLFLKDVEDYSKLIIDIRGNIGGKDEYWMELVGLLTDQPLEAQYYSFFKDGHRLEGDAYKVEGVTTIADLDEGILKDLPEELGKDFNFYKINNIKIDPLGEVNFKGKVYLLVDGKVNLQAENFASFAKDTGFATLVGEATGGNKVFENIPIVFLRNTKFAITYPRELVINSERKINMEMKTIPDIEVDPRVDEDFNKDKAIQAVIND